MIKQWRLMAVELAAHWRAYRRAVSTYEPVPFAWTSIGYRIRTTGEALRKYMGFDNPRNDEKCAEAVGLDIYVFSGKKRILFIEHESEAQVEKQIKLFDDMNVRSKVDQRRMWPWRHASRDHAQAVAGLLDKSFNGLCVEMLNTAGTLTFGGRRRKRERTFYRTTKQELVPESALPGPWEFLSFGLARPVPSRKRWKTPRAVARGENVFIRYKDRDVFFKACVTEDGARNIAARINGRKPKVSRLTRTFDRKLCPHCDQSVATSWWKRHQEMYHASEDRPDSDGRNHTPYVAQGREQTATCGV